MNIYDFSKMLKYELYTEYEYQAHRWRNENLPCGCIHAICLDIEPNKDDTQYVSERILKINSLKALIKEIINIEENTYEKVTVFLNKIENTQNELLHFIHQKRQEYNFPNTMDFNGDFYYIKLRKGSNCSTI
jgi:hypothetical protein